MRRYLAVLGFALGVGSCGTPVKTCGPASCDGCCDEGGDCHAGTGLFECGSGGGMCVACSPTQACLEFSCQLIDGGDYDAAFPMDPDGSYNLDAGVYDASRPDSGFDAGTDAGRPDGGADAGRDAGIDAGFDAGRPDAGVDAGFDAGFDAGLDAGRPDAGDAGDEDAGDGG